MLVGSDSTSQICSKLYCKKFSGKNTKMSSFALVSIEKDYKIDVCEGKITVGRGPFLKITDKRVSRNHATFEVCDGSLTVLPIHTNPTFYQACGESKFTPLEKDEVKKLENGDCISFLPNDLTFRVEKKITLVVGNTTGEEAFEDKEALEHKEPIKHKEILEHKELIEHEAADVSGLKDCNFECSSEVLENTDGKDKKVSNVQVSSVEMNKESEDLDSEVLEDEEEDDDVDDEEDDDRIEIEETARPLNKTRVLPSWMTKNEGKTTKTNVKKDANEVKINKDSVEMPGKTKENLEEIEDTTNDGNDKEQSEDVSVETAERVKEEEKKRKRDESENEGQSNKREKKLPRCPYGSRCYRKNPVHFQEYSHEEESEENENEEEDDLPECPYGEYCYRKNPRHRREYKHTPQPKTRERKAKKKAGTGKIRDDDEDGPNDYDYEDSFIDDESESNHEASDDSDWRPSGDDDGDDGNDGDDDDVRELLSEARNFTKNKKMLKPT